MYKAPQGSMSPDPAPGAAETADSHHGEEGLAAKLAQAESERDQALASCKRAQADFQNYQRRAILNEDEARKQGTTAVLMSVFPVLDHFDLALTQSTPDDASRRIMDGVRVIRDELIRALERHGVALINPKPGDPFDPTRHQAVVEQPAEGVPPGQISAVLQVGYMLEGRVIRSAMVAVAPRQ